MNSHHQDSVVLNSPSSSPALPPRAAPVGGKTCPVGHVHMPPHLPHHALPPITPPHTMAMDRPAPKSPVDRTKEHDTENVPPVDDNQPVEENNYIPDAVEETTVQNLLGQSAKRQYI